MGHFLITLSSLWRDANGATIRVFAGSTKEEHHENRTHTSTSSSCSSVIGHLRLRSGSAIVGGQCPIRLHRWTYQHGSGPLLCPAAWPIYRNALKCWKIGDYSHHPQRMSAALR